MSPEELVADVARRYDNDEGDLQRAVLARLAWRRARSGRYCFKCQQTKPISEYGRDVRERDGLRRECRSCVAARNAEAYARRR